MSTLPKRGIPRQPEPTESGQTTLDPVVAKLTTLGLEHPALVLPELVEQAERDELSPLAFLDLLLTSQLERKDERRITTMLKLSGLPPGKTLEAFDWGFQPKADRRQIETLATCSYLREKTNVLFLGPPGRRQKPLGDRPRRHRDQKRVRRRALCARRTDARPEG